jgi:hypothetical protein
MDEIQKKGQRVFSLLFTVTSTALPRDFYKTHATLTVSVKEKGGKPDKKP